MFPLSKAQILSTWVLSEMSELEICRVWVMGLFVGWTSEWMCCMILPDSIWRFEVCERRSCCFLSEQLDDKMCVEFLCFVIVDLPSLPMLFDLFNAGLYPALVHYYLPAWFHLTDDDLTPSYYVTFILLYVRIYTYMCVCVWFWTLNSTTIQTKSLKNTQFEGCIGNINHSHCFIVIAWNCLKFSKFKVLEFLLDYGLLCLIVYFKCMWTKERQRIFKFVKSKCN